MKQQITPLLTFRRNVVYTCAILLHQIRIPHETFRTAKFSIASLAFFACMMLFGIPSKATIGSTSDGCAVWNQTGHTLSAGTGNTPGMALDASGVPYVVFQDNANNNKVTVMKYNGASWVTVGSSSLPVGGSGTSIAFNSAGTIPFIAYKDSANGNKITVKKFTGSSWVTVGSAGCSLYQGDSTAIAVDGTGIPYFAYLEDSLGLGAKAVRVMKFNGTSWDTLGPRMGVEYVPYILIYNISLKIGSGNTPYMVYNQYNPGGGFGPSFTTYVQKYTSGSWVSVGDAFSGTDFPSLAISPSGTPYLAYNVYNSFGTDYRVHIQSFNGTSWNDVGTFPYDSTGFITEHQFQPSITTDASGNPYVIYSDGDYPFFYVMAFKYDGVQWDSVGRWAFVADSAQYSAIAIGSSGKPYVVIQYGVNDSVQVFERDPFMPGAISGPSSVYVDSSATLTDTSFGVWNSSNTAVAFIDSFSGSLFGVAAGTTTITFTTENSYGCVSSVTKVITVSTPVGPGGLCVGNTTTLTGSPSGGTWTSSNGVVATIGSSTGIVTGHAAGTATMTYTVGSTHTTQVVTVNANPLPIQGATSECLNATVTLSDATAGGTWSGSNSNVSVSGANVTGAAVGTGTITYTLSSGCYATYPMTVKANPSAIYGTTTLCAGGTTSLTDSTSGSLSWASSNTSVATVVNSGVVTGVAAGSATITYKVTSGCTTTTVVNVTSAPAGITNNSAVCAGSSVTLSDATAGGAWSSSNTAIATAASTGVVTGVAGGTAKVTYSTGAGCNAIVTVTVNPILPITGSSSVNAGSTITLNDATTGGTWSSSNTGVGSISTTGVVRGISAGTTMITYTTSTCMRYATVTVIAGGNPINGTLALCAGTNTTLTDATAGGTWSISSALIATIGSAGLVTASTTYTGTATISYTAGGVLSTAVLTVNPKPSPIQGASSECMNATITLSDATAGGAWSSSNTNVTFAGTTGSPVSVTGAATGSSTITYTAATGCYITYPNTIYAIPAAITGTFVLCAGTSTTLTDATGGGVSWTSSNTTVATNVGSTVTGVSAGTANITYKITTGSCYTTQTITVNAITAVTTISGPASISHATPATLSDVTAGGVWTSSNSAVISLSGSTGSPVTATAVATSGSATITYAVTNGSGCITRVIKSISATPAPPHHGGSATGSISMLVGATVNLADEVMSGTWSSSDDGIATVGNNGVVTATRPGSVNITHTITNSQGVSTSITPVVVSAIPASVTLLPNPNKGIFTVKGTLGSMEDEAVMLEVTDVLGHIIYKSSVTAQGGRLNETITMDNSLTAGMYLLNVVSSTEKEVIHFVIEK